MEQEHLAKTPDVLTPEALPKQHSIDQVLATEGVQGVETGADTLAQTEIHGIERLATVRPEDTAVAPEDTKALEESSAQATEEIKTARRELGLQIRSAVEADSVSQSVEYVATANHVDQAPPSVAEAARSHEAPVTESTEHATPMGEDPAARQQKTTESADHTENTNTRQETAQSETAPLAQESVSASQQPEANTSPEQPTPNSGTASTESTSSNVPPPPTQATEAPPVAQETSVPPSASTEQPAPQQERRSNAPPTLEHGVTEEFYSYVQGQGSNAFKTLDPQKRKNAYRKLMIAFHPDRIPPNSAEKLKTYTLELFKIVSSLEVFLDMSALETDLYNVDVQLEEMRTLELSDPSKTSDANFLGLKKKYLREQQQLVDNIDNEKQNISKLYGKYIRGMLKLKTLLPGAEPAPGATSTESASANVPPPPTQAPEAPPAPQETTGTNSTSPEQAVPAPGTTETPPPATAEAATDSSASQPEQATQTETATATPEQTQTQAPAEPESQTAPGAETNDRNYAEEVRERRKQRFSSAESAYAKAQDAVTKHKASMEEFRSHNGDSQLPIDRQYMKLMDAHLKSLETAEEIARLELRKAQIAEEIQTLSEKQATAKTEEEKAAIQELINDLHADDAKLDSRILALQAQKTARDKAVEDADYDYRVENAKELPAHEGESQLKEEQKTTTQKEQEARDEKITGAKPDEKQAPGFGDKLEELRKQFKKVFWDDIVN